MHFLFNFQEYSSPMAILTKFYFPFLILAFFHFPLKIVALTHSQQINEIIKELMREILEINEQGKMLGKFDLFAFEVQDLTGGPDARPEHGTLEFLMRKSAMEMALVANELHKMANNMLDQLKMVHQMLRMCLMNVEECCKNMDEMVSEIGHAQIKSTIKLNDFKRKKKHFFEDYQKYKNWMLGELRKKRESGLEKVGGKFEEEEKWLGEMAKKLNNHWAKFLEVQNELNAAAKKPIDEIVGEI